MVKTMGIFAATKYVLGPKKHPSTSHKDHKAAKFPWFLSMLMTVL